MEEIKEGFKLVRKNQNKKFHSAYLYGYPIEYKINVFVYPTNGDGPLAVFDTFRNAKNFLGGLSKVPLKIFKCKYTKSEENHLWFMNNKYKFTKKTLPIGTICADKVMLIEKIE